MDWSQVSAAVMLAWRWEASTPIRRLETGSMIFNKRSSFFIMQSLAIPGLHLHLFRAFHILLRGLAASFTKFAADSPVSQAACKQGFTAGCVASPAKNSVLSTGRAKASLPEHPASAPSIKYVDTQTVTQSCMQMANIESDVPVPNLCAQAGIGICACNERLL